MPTRSRCSTCAPSRSSVARACASSVGGRTSPRGIAHARPDAARPKLARGVANGDRARADEGLAFLKRDVGDAAERRVDLLERAFGAGISLDGVNIAVAGGLDARGSVGGGDALCGAGGSGRIDWTSPSGIGWPGKGRGSGMVTSCTAGGGLGMRTAARGLSPRNSPTAPTSIAPTSVRSSAWCTP